MKTITTYFLLTFCICSIYGQKMPNENITKEDQSQLINELSNMLDRHYLYADTALIMGDFLNKKLESGAYEAITTARQFSIQITNDLRDNFNDRHIGLSYAPKLAKSIQSNSSDKGEIPEEVIKEQLAIEIYNNFRLPEVKWLNGNIGYIKLDQLLPPTLASGYEEKVAAVFELVADTDALILDLRSNGGGYAEGVKLILSYFFNNNTIISNSISRIDGNLVRSEERTYHVKGRRVLTQNIYVLVSARTGSGAEAIAHTFKYSGRGILIGEKTYGAGYSFDEFTISKKYVAQIPNSTSMHPNASNNWEGVGVMPNIEVSSNEALEIARRVAIKDLLEKEKSKAKNLQYSYRLKSLQWENNRLEDLKNINTLSKDQILEVVGQYGNRKIFNDNDELFYQRMNPDRPIKRLIPVGQDEFLIEGMDEYRIKFIRNEKSNKITALRFFSIDRLFIDEKTKV